MTFSGSSGNPLSTAGSANITTDAGATLQFQGFSTGGTAQLTANSGGYTDFSREGAVAVTVGSIAGSGTYNLGSSDVVVGANGLNTSVSGVIEDGGSGGSLTKIGADILTLSGNNTYTGGTLIDGGILSVDTGGTLGTGAVTNNSDLFYIDSATAENANITNVSTGLLSFQNTSAAGGATITDNGGEVSFSNLASGGAARLILNGTGYLNISGESSVPVTLGSIEGSGFITLGAEELAAGSNNLNTTFTGTITDGGLSGGVIKVGTGTWTLSGASSYGGGTDITNGTLVAANANALGTAFVDVTGGTLSLGVGKLNIGSNYNQLGAGTLQLGLNQATPNQWDSLRVAGIEIWFWPLSTALPFTTTKLLPF
jgi:autotransporter-associated beta strand protein